MLLPLLAVLASMAGGMSAQGIAQTEGTGQGIYLCSPAAGVPCATSLGPGQTLQAVASPCPKNFICASIVVSSSAAWCQHACLDHEAIHAKQGYAIYDNVDARSGTSALLLQTDCNLVRSPLIVCHLHLPWRLDRCNPFIHSV